MAGKMKNTGQWFGLDNLEKSGILTIWLLLNGYCLTLGSEIGVRGGRPGREGNEEVRGVRGGKGEGKRARGAEGVR